LLHSKPIFLLDKRNLYGYNTIMIKSFKHKGLEDFFYFGNKKGIRPEHASRLERILDRLNAAADLKDMNYPGSNLHKLTRDKKDHYSVHVSGNWRVIFEFKGGDVYFVNYNDYH
jgi:proteic killer suppression protein